MIKQTILLLPLLMAACLFSPQTPFEPEYSIESFQIAWEQHEALYPLFIYKGIDWVEICREFYPMAAEADNQEELLLVLSDMIAVLEDPALFIFSMEGDTLFPYTRQLSSNVNMDVLMENYLQPNAYAGNVQGFGWCDPAVFPYAYFNSFPTITDTLGVQAYDAFIEQCVALRLPAVILDIRMNPSGAPGGFSNFDQLVMSRLVTKAKVSAVYRVRTGPEYDQYQDWHPWIQPAGSNQYDGTIYLLTGGGCTQAAEDMAVNLSYFTNVTLIGDTTAGSITVTQTVILPGEPQWLLKIGTGTVLSHDFQWIEGVGIAPDYYVEATEADFTSGVDPVLEFAMNMLAQ